MFSKSSSANVLPPAIAKPSAKTNVRGPLIEQYVSDVIDFSSQYGSDSSISFSASNIVDRPTKYPVYGDFPETFAMVRTLPKIQRTYGPWPQRAPSHQRTIQPQNMSAFASQDHIVIGFEDYVWPMQMSIYESYNPGAICQIWALTQYRWQLLWERCTAPQTTQNTDDDIKPAESPRPPHQYRIFCPPLSEAETPCRVMRLDFYHRHLDYYAELDAVLLTGYRCSDEFAISLRSNSDCDGNALSVPVPPWREGGRIQRVLKAAAFQAKSMPDVATAEAVLQEFLNHDMEQFAMATDDDVNATVTAKAFIQQMPFEILLHIASYLDLVSLCRLAVTCRQMREIALDPHLYRAINLQPYWSLPPLDVSLLDRLQSRCPLLRELDLSSSCCSRTGIQSADIERFVRSSGCTLRVLRLASCGRLMRASCVTAVATYCSGLRELTLHNFRRERGMWAEQLLPLAALERLDLYRADVETEGLCRVLARNDRLRHLNLGQSSTQMNMDAVATQLATTNRQLRSLDMWKTYGLSTVGLAALGECVELQELDIGWCLRSEAALGDSLQRLLMSDCGTGLRRLGLASIRGLGPDDLDMIGRRCSKLEQLELMGIREVSAEKCVDILNRCIRLELLDVSFCHGIDAICAAHLRERYPQVSIKRSYANEGPYSDGVAFSVDAF